MSDRADWRGAVLAVVFAVMGIGVILLVLALAAVLTPA